MKRWQLKFGLGVLVLALGIMTGGKVMADNETKTAIFAGGCFWCMQSEFDSEKGVVKTEVGYSGGAMVNPSYEDVSGGMTGHRESIEVTYDPHVVTYPRLLEIFWSNIDPLDATGQFCDKGDQYKAAIFVANDEERAAAQESAVTVSKRLKQPVVTDILTRKAFYSAEEHHQEYYKKSATAYQLYRAGCGRDGRLKELNEQMK